MRGEVARRPAPVAALGLALAGALALGAAVLLGGAAGAVARGWLAGWLFCLWIGIGAALWLLIRGLTGGRWTDAAGPVLRVLSLSVPLLAIGGAGFVLAAPLLYPWWDVAGSTRQEVYLAQLPFALRTAAVLVVWAGLGLIAPLRPGALVAGIGLIVYAVSLTFAGLDWVQSLDPEFGSTTFAALMAALQLGLALALGAVLGLPGEGRAVADWGGLMMATLLGVFYLAAMQYLVLWTGNLPPDAAWYEARNAGVPFVAISGATLAGLVGPFAVLLSSRLRGSAGVLAVIGALQLASGLVYLLWLVTPDLGGRRGAFGAGVGGAVRRPGGGDMAQRRPAMSDRDPIQERDRWPVGGTLMVLGGVLAFLCLSLAAVWGIFPQVRDVGVPPPERFPTPTLETAPVPDYLRWRVLQDAALAGGGDRMPISEAMAEIARRGAAAYEPEPAQ